MQSFYLNKVLFWLPLTIVGFLNGAFRVFVLNRFLEDAYSHQVSTLLLIVLIILYTEFVYHKLNIKSSHDAWLTGMSWTFLTAVFEFALGYFGSGLTFRSMLEAYDLLGGNLWTLVLLAILTIPWLNYKYGEEKVSEAK